MLASQQFCVKWNSYSSNLQNVFPRLLTSEHFVDITLACEGQMIKCHKVVLSACSTYFEKLLVQNPCQHPIIFMKDMKHWEVQALVDFMYKGEVNVSQDELNSLLVAAEALQIRGLCGSEHANRSSHDNSRQGQSNSSSAPSRIPSVSLPHDTVLSGGTTVGRESPPFKRRRPLNEEKEHIQSQVAASRISNVVSTTNSRGEVNSLSTPQMPTVDQIRTDGFAEEMDEDLPDKKPIKQELDVDDSYLEADLDADGPDEDYGSLEHQEDSDSNNREDAPPHSPLDQPGPSGLGPPSNAPVDKAATGATWPYPMVTAESPMRLAFSMARRGRGRPRKQRMILPPSMYLEVPTKPTMLTPQVSLTPSTLLQHPTLPIQMTAQPLHYSRSNIYNRNASGTAMLPPPEPPVVGSSRVGVTIVEDYIPTSASPQQLPQPEQQGPFGGYNPQPMNMFGSLPGVRVKRRFITPEKKQRELELARERKKRFRERQKEKERLKLAECKAGK